MRTAFFDSDKEYKFKEFDAAFSSVNGNFTAVENFERYFTLKAVKFTPDGIFENYYDWYTDIPTHKCPRARF